MDVFEKLFTAIVDQMVDDGIVEVGTYFVRFHRFTEDGYEENFISTNDGYEVFSGTEDECKAFMDNEVEEYRKEVADADY
jgi:hypothetical protein